MCGEIEATTALEAVTKALARRYISPLRYPGGKRKLVTHVAAALDRHLMHKVDRVIEPFAGGAAMSIALVEAGVAREAILTTSIRSFPRLVCRLLQHHFALADRILDARVTLQEWEKQKASDRRTSSTRRSNASS